jgi:glycosyltransferase involved in cell wall biosynthesis
MNRIVWLRGRRFDLVHAFESRPTVIYPALYVHRQGVPLVMDWADWFGKGGSVEERPNPLVRGVLRPVETFFEEHFRTRAQGTTVICSLLYQKARALGIPEQQILCLRNGADLENRKAGPAGQARQAVGLPQDAPVIGYVGSIFPGDARLMAAAFNQVLLSFPDTRLVIAGYCPYDIRPAVSRPENVVQTGYVETSLLNQYLSACDLFWLPLKDSNANRGRFPYKLTDYMALGRPVIATAVGDIPEIVQGAQIGLTSPDQPGPFAECTLRLLRSPEQRAEMGQRARALAEAEYDWKKIAADLERFYQRVVEQP